MESEDVSECGALKPVDAGSPVPSNCPVGAPGSPPQPCKAEGKDVSECGALETVHSGSPVPENGSSSAPGSPPQPCRAEEKDVSECRALEAVNSGSPAPDKGPSSAPGSPPEPKVISKVVIPAVFEQSPDFKPPKRASSPSKAEKVSNKSVEIRGADSLPEINGIYAPVSRETWSGGLVYRNRRTQIYLVWNAKPPRWKVVQGKIDSSEILAYADCSVGRHVLPCAADGPWILVERKNSCSLLEGSDGSVGPGVSSSLVEESEGAEGDCEAEGESMAEIEIQAEAPGEAEVEAKGEGQCEGDSDGKGEGKGEGEDDVEGEVEPQEMECIFSGQAILVSGRSGHNQRLNGVFVEREEDYDNFPCYFDKQKHMFIYRKSRDGPAWVISNRLGPAAQRGRGVIFAEVRDDAVQPYLVTNPWTVCAWGTRVAEVDPSISISLRAESVREGPPPAVLSVRSKAHEDVVGAYVRSEGERVNEATVYARAAAGSAPAKFLFWDSERWCIAGSTATSAAACDVRSQRREVLARNHPDDAVWHGIEVLRGDAGAIGSMKRGSVRAISQKFT